MGDSLRARDGRLGERLARWFLERRGYRLREPNARVGRYEIDLVMQKGDLLVFVEVKWRSAGSWGAAASALGAAQRRRLAAAASAYAARHRAHRIRLDVVAIDDAPDRMTITHVPDAFGEGGGRR